MSEREGRVEDERKTDWQGEAGEAVQVSVEEAAKRKLWGGRVIN